MHASLPDVPVQLFYVAANADYVKRLGEVLGKVFTDNVDKASNWLTLTPLREPAFTHGLSSLEEYSLVLKGVEFWDDVMGEQVLMFQTDSWICRNAAEKLRKFADFHYVGAPWDTDNEATAVSRNCHGSTVGNGGLSLRTRSVMREAAALGDARDPPLPEDVFFCEELTSRGLGKVAPRDLALSFSDETMLDADRDPFGVHKLWLWHSINEVSKACPGMNTLYQGQFYPKDCDANAMDWAEKVLHNYKSLAVARLSASRHEEYEELRLW